MASIWSKNGKRMKRGSTLTEIKVARTKQKQPPHSNSYKPQEAPTAIFETMERKKTKAKMKNKGVGGEAIFIAILINHVATSHWPYSNYYSRLLLPLLKRRVGATSETLNPFKFYTPQPFHHPSTRTIPPPGSTNTGVQKSARLNRPGSLHQLPSPPESTRVGGQT